MLYRARLSGQGNVIDIVPPYRRDFPADGFLVNPLNFILIKNFLLFTIKEGKYNVSWKKVISQNSNQEVKSVL